MSQAVLSQPNNMQVRNSWGVLILDREYDEEQFILLARSLACVTGSRIVLQERGVIVLPGTEHRLEIGSKSLARRFCDAVIAGVPVWEAL